MSPLTRICRAVSENEDALIRRFDLMAEYWRRSLSETRKVFEKRATVKKGLKDIPIHISFEDSSPKRAAEIANAYVDQFRVLSQHLAITEAAQRQLFLEQQVKQTKGQLANSEEAMKQTQQKTEPIELDSQARALIESAAYLRAQIVAKQVQIEGMRSYATDQNAGVKQAEKELASMRAQMERPSGSKDTDGMIVPRGRVTAGRGDVASCLHLDEPHPVYLSSLHRVAEVPWRKTSVLPVPRDAPVLSDGAAVGLCAWRGERLE